MDVILNGFGKKPLVTFSIIFIVIMCLTLCEAAPRPPAAHKKRHNRLLNDNHNIRHHNNRLNNKFSYSTALSPRQKKPNTPYKTETWKITKTLNNMENNFNLTYQPIRNLTSGTLDWMAKVNFVYINSETMRRTNLKDRFLILYPRLYQYLLKEQRIFEGLQNVTVNPSEEPVYLKQRARLISQTIIYITNAISELNDSLTALHLKIPAAKQMNSISLAANGFIFSGNDTEIYEQDQRAFNRFWNTTKNWIAEFKCALKPESNFCVKRRNQLHRRSRKLKTKQ